MALDKLKSSALDTNIDVDGTLDVTGILTADAAGSVAGNFGIGTTSPGQKLEVNSGNSTVGMRVRRFTGSYYSDIVHTDSPEGLAFKVGDGSSVTERLRILGSGGITFNGDTATANALDDYETGTWTPSLNSNETYNYRYGTYVKVGDMVVAQFDVSVNAINSGSSSELYGFPFTAYNGGTVYSGCISYYAGINQTVYSLDFYLINNQTIAYFSGHTTASPNIGNALSVWKNGARILGTVAYRAA